MDGAQRRGSRVGWRLKAAARRLRRPSMTRSVKMKLVLSSLLLASLCSLSSWSVSSGTLHVTQSPDVSVPEGGALNVSCCWMGNFVNAHVSFMVKHTNMKNQTSASVLFKETHVKNISNCSIWIIEQITIKDSGIYYCKVTVDIPALIEVMGNGTVVTVTPKEGEEQENKREGSPLVIITLAVVVPLLLVALTCVCLVLRRKREQAVRVIYEVPHVSSDMDKDSAASSRGSSEWRQVPLYDYFERVQAPDSK